MKIEKVAHWVEIGANLGIIVTLLLLVTEVRSNTAVLEREALLDHARAMNYPFFENPQMAEILARIKEVDGWEGDTYELAFSERYGVPIESAIIWGRHLSMVWASLESDFVVNGASRELEQRVRKLLSFPDNQLMWQAKRGFFGEDFRDYIESVRIDESTVGASNGNGGVGARVADVQPAE